MGLNPAPQRIGVYGGAFDPPHRMHVSLAQTALTQLALDVLHVVPTGEAWHRARPMTAPAHRLAMAELAFAPLAGARVDPQEMQRQGPSYTVDTLRALQSRHPHALLHLIIGADQARALPTWHAWQDIVAMAVIVVAERREGTSPAETAPLPGARYHQLQLEPVDTSATDIRQRAATGQDFSHLVPEAVARYIAQHHLYQTAR